MLRSFFSFLLLFIFANAATAQTREELEKQRRELKKDIEETQRLLNSKNAEAKKNLSVLSLINTNVNRQDRVIENISKDLHILDNNIYTIQKDINKYDKLLDTLKQEYAKSMVYAYKNRGNYEFLNFIFSADNFNDAIKRVAYLKSYRNYREMQGENILRTQELRRKRLEDLGVSKKTKSTTLDLQSKEMTELEQQKAEQAQIVKALQKDAKTLNNNLAAKKKQAVKVQGMIDAVIREAIAEAKRESARLAAEEKRKRDAAETARLKALKDKTNNPTATVTPPAKTTTPVIAPKPIKQPESELLNSGNIALNADFKKNLGSLPWPVDEGNVIMHYGDNVLGGGTKIHVVSTTIASKIGSPIKVIFAGTVKVVNDDIVIVQHGRYFTTYINVANVSVKKGDELTTGQTIGRVQANDDGIGAMEIQASDERTNFDPERWLKRRG
jgi:septal ring factor EnvC (AmiA/AmiB activator)